MKNRVVFMGTPEFSVPVLEALVSNSDVTVVAVYTQPDRTAGRGRKLTVSPLKGLALNFALPVMQPETLKNKAAEEGMRKFAPDIVVVSAYGKIIPENILSLPPFGCLNIHPSLLPRYRGATPIPGAILNGDSSTGVSIMLLDRGMDTGPVLMQREEKILEDDTAATLSSKLSRIAANLLLEVMPLWLARKIQPEPQDERLATYTRPIVREDSRMDWSRSAVELWRRVRAYQPWPGCYTSWLGRNLKISQVKPLQQLKTLQPGRVIPLEGIDGSEAGVECAAGVLALQRLQLEGKKEMACGEFIRGQRDFIGSVLL